jgi:hypothetical protein
VGYQARRARHRHPQARSALRDLGTAAVLIGAEPGLSAGGNAGRVVSRGEILDAMWGVDYVAENNLVDRKIRDRARPADDQLA